MADENKKIIKLTKKTVLSVDSQNNNLSSSLPEDRVSQEEENDKAFDYVIKLVESAEKDRLKILKEIIPKLKEETKLKLKIMTQKKAEIGTYLAYMIFTILLLFLPAFKSAPSHLIFFVVLAFIIAVFLLGFLLPLKKLKELYPEYAEANRDYLDHEFILQMFNKELIERSCGLKGDA